MAVDMFIKIGSFNGEATEDNHKKWIPVDSFSWGVTHTTDVVGTGLASGKASFQDFTLSKSTDAASPLIAKACANGDHIKDAEIHFCQSTGKRLVWMSYKFTECMISSFSIGGGGGGDRPSESISISFGKYEQKYQPTDDKGGLGTPIPAGYDLKLNKAL